MALELLHERGYTLLPTPLRPPAARLAKLAKLPGAEGGEGEGVAWDVLAAQHGGEWLQTGQLPLRYALLRPAPPRGGGGEAVAGAGGGGVGDVGDVHLELCEIWPDDGASWPGLQALAQLTHELHARLGLSAREHEARPRTRTRTRTRVPSPPQLHPIASPDRHPSPAPVASARRQPDGRR